MGRSDDTAGHPLCVLLLPAPLERFILRDQAEDLLRSPRVVAAFQAVLAQSAAAVAA